MVRVSKSNIIPLVNMVEEPTLPSSISYQPKNFHQVVVNFQLEDHCLLFLFV